MGGDLTAAIPGAWRPVAASVAGTSHLAADQPRYWELEVTCERPGIDFCARFLVPVYAAAPAVVDVKPR